MAGQFLNNKAYITAGLESLNWLYEVYTTKKKNAFHWWVMTAGIAKESQDQI